MSPIFMVVLKGGKTDNIFEADFIEGSFKGAKKYGYDDIKDFIVPKEIILTLTGGITKDTQSSSKRNENNFKKNEKMENG